MIWETIIKEFLKFQSFNIENWIEIEELIILSFIYCNIFFQNFVLFKIQCGPKVWDHIQYVYIHTNIPYMMIFGGMVV